MCFFRPSLCNFWLIFTFPLLLMPRFHHPCLLCWLFFLYRHCVYTLLVSSDVGRNCLCVLFLLLLLLHLLVPEVYSFDRLDSITFFMCSCVCVFCQRSPTIFFAWTGCHRKPFNHSTPFLFCSSVFKTFNLSPSLSLLLIQSYLFNLNLKTRSWDHSWSILFNSLIFFNAKT